MKIKTPELSGAALDWAVAKANGVTVKLSPTGYLVYSDKSIPTGPQGRVYQPSKVWAQGGPIIDQELIALDHYWRNLTDEHPGGWEFRAASTSDEPQRTWINGPTNLIAAMRCFVASKLGDEVDVPEELCA